MPLRFFYNGGVPNGRPVAQSAVPGATDVLFQGTPTGTTLPASPTTTPPILATPPATTIPNFPTTGTIPQPTTPQAPVDTSVPGRVPRVPIAPQFQEANRPTNPDQQIIAPGVPTGTGGFIPAAGEQVGVGRPAVPGSIATGVNSEVLLGLINRRQLGDTSLTPQEQAVLDAFDEDANRSLAGVDEAFQQQRLQADILGQAQIDVNTTPSARFEGTDTTRTLGSPDGLENRIVSTEARFEPEQFLLDRSLGPSTESQQRLREYAEQRDTRGVLDAESIETYQEFTKARIQEELDGARSTLRNDVLASRGLDEESLAIRQEMEDFTGVMESFFTRAATQPGGQRDIVSEATLLGVLAITLRGQTPTQFITELERRQSALADLTPFFVDEENNRIPLNLGFDTITVNGRQIPRQGGSADPLEEIENNLNAVLGINANTGVFDVTEFRNKLAIDEDYVRQLDQIFTELEREYNLLGTNE